METTEYYKPDGTKVIITGPSADELRPTPEEQKEVQRLLNSEKRSMKPEYDWPVGKPCPFG